MQITTVTTKVHTATFAAEDLKSVALSAVKAKVSVDDASVASSDVTMGEDGSLKVEIVENVPTEPVEAANKTDGPASDAAKPDAPTPVIPTSLNATA